MSSNCDNYILCNFSNGCACVKYDPITGQIAIDGELVKLYTQAASVVTAETLTGAALNPAIKIVSSSITDFCGGVVGCLSGLPEGSIDAAAIKPGKTGEVLQTIAGKTAWAPLDDGAIQKAFADNPVPLPPIDANELAKVYGEDSSANLVAVKPAGAYESAVSSMPFSTAAAPLKIISGVDAGGMAIKTKITPRGQRTTSTNTTATNAPFPSATNIEVASVVVPTSGMYGIEIGYSSTFIYAGGPALGARNNQREWYVSTPAGRPYDVIGVDIFPSVVAQVAGASMLLDTVKTGTAIVKLTAGDVVKLAVYANNTIAPGNITANGAITLIKLADTDVDLG